MNTNDALEAAIQQMRASGVDEATIEIYRQQMAMAQQMASNPMLSALTQQAAAFAQQMQNTDFQSDFVNSLLGEEDVEMKPETTLTPAQQWAVACGADLAFLNGYPLNTLEEDMDKRTMKKQLSEWWGVKNKEDLLGMLDYLEEGGQRNIFALIDKAVRKGSEEAAEEFLAGKIQDEEQLEVAVERLNNMLEAYEQFKEDGLWTESTTPNFIAWDMVRLINLCRNGFDAGYLSEEEALTIIVDVAQQLQKEFKSWRDLSIAYQFGRYVWGGDDQYEDLKDGMETLLSNKKSPWVNLDWNMNLGS